MSKHSPERIRAARSNVEGVLSYLRSIGEDVVQVGTSEYSIKSSRGDRNSTTSLRINVDKGIFIRNSNGNKGDMIDYLRLEHGMSFHEAVETLTPNWYEYENSYRRPIDYAVQNREKPSQIVSKPQTAGKESDYYELNESKNAPRVIAYLTKTRGISSQTVFWLLNKNLLAQDSRGNAVFRVLDEKGEWKGAERRGTMTFGDKAFKNSTPETGYGFTLTFGTPKKLCIFEAAIDTISFYEIYKDKIKDMALVSLAGTQKETTLHETIKRYKEQFGIEDKNIIFCVDRDEGGDKFIRKWKDVYKSGIFRVKEPFKDWNELLVAVKEKNRQSPTMSNNQRNLNDWKSQAQSRANERATAQEHSAPQKVAQNEYER